jgi:L-iditol 2-dehydrogenase
MEEMLAASYYGTKDIRVEKRTIPVSTDDNVIVKVNSCAICGTDLKIFNVGNPRCTPPRIIGHELVGTIIQTGRNVKGFSVKERITLATTVACNHCEICALGFTNMCPHAKPVSYDFDGGFAEYLAIPEEAIKGGNVIKVPETVPDDFAALAEPVSCAINAQEIAGVKKGDTVLIIGGGPLGAIHAKVAKVYGASKVMISQRSEPRLSMLKKLPDVMVIDGDLDLGEIVKRETNGLGVDVVIVCAPEKNPQQESVNYVRKGGTVSLFASLPKGRSEITFDSRVIHYNEIRIVGASDSRPEHVQKAIDLMAEKKLDLSHIVTHKVSLGDFHLGLKLMLDKKSLKVLVIPGY